MNKILSNKNRINSLDLLRGIALLGILLMNITSFSQVGGAYMNPKLGAGLAGYNKYFWDFNWLFADMKFMSLFSILFGAGIVLFSENIKAKGLKEWKWKYKRLFFLLVFGIIHAYFIWNGDILVAYSLCGALVFQFRNFKLKTLWILAVIFFVIPILFKLNLYYNVPETELLKIFDFWNPSESELAKEIQIFQGSYINQTPQRIKGAIELQTVVFLFESFWRITSLMILGMILYKSKILSAQRSNNFYTKLAIIGILMGLVISYIGLLNGHKDDWNAPYSMTLGRLSNYIASIPMALGYTGLIMLWAKSNTFLKLKHALQSAGRMAFTNYIGMSVLCSFIFYGFGFGLFEQVDRLQQLLIVLLIWGIILIISPIVLKKFRYGPLEYLWRKLTYFKFIR